ncbi:hypothetical protein [Prosthecobacter fluviatilis]|uniref:Uncharacterized protein n=1 Tax=Prosthecobacter fluviatilis TaxID=445931 RepID=A0ABW0KPI2_9BACT
MKTFFRKLKLSFLAMLWGLNACNIAWWTCHLHHSTQDLSFLGPVLLLWLNLYTSAVIAGACFLVLMTLDLLIPETSPLRKPGTAAAFGFLVSLALGVAFTLARLSGHSIQAYGLVEAAWKTLGRTLPYTLGACAAGTVAAWSRALMDTPSPRQTP